MTAARELIVLEIYRRGSDHPDAQNPAMARLQGSEFLFSSPKNRGHHTRATVAMEDGNHP